MSLAELAILCIHESCRYIFWTFVVRVVIGFSLVSSSVKGQSWLAVDHSTSSVVLALAVYRPVYALIMSRMSHEEYNSCDLTIMRWSRNSESVMFDRTPIPPRLNPKVMFR